MSDNIPFDIQMEIVKKVSNLKSLIQFRSVSKLWKSFIDGSEFINGYGVHHTQPHSHILSYRIDSHYLDYELKYICLVEDNIETFKVQQQDIAPFVVSPLLKEYQIRSFVGACHGLLCLYCFRPEDKDILVIWNPSIGKSFGIALPECDLQTFRQTSYGFGVRTTLPLLSFRLAMVISDIVSNTQSAFIAGRQFLDGPFIINEILDWCKRRCKKVMFFKVDFAKAYDSVRWEYLIDVLKAFGFGFEMVPMGFKSLHLSFNRVVDAGIFKGIRLNNSLSISHLFYADDALIIGEWSNDNLRSLTNVLHCFYLASGLRINFHKSQLLGVGVHTSDVSLAAASIGVFRYHEESISISWSSWLGKISPHKACRELRLLSNSDPVSPNRRLKLSLLVDASLS
ncbi:RNA-directed DNA polymerase, eukaryota [Tanacetum coccineum]